MKNYVKKQKNFVRLRIFFFQKMYKELEKKLIKKELNE